MKGQPSPSHRLYVKVGRPHVKRWIQPAAKPDPNVWVLAQEVDVPASQVLESVAPEAKASAVLASIETPEGEGNGFVDLQDLPEVAPKAAPKAKAGRKPKAPKTTE